MLTKFPYHTARLTFHGDAVSVTRGSSTIGTKDDSGGLQKNGFVNDTAGEGTATEPLGGTTTNAG